MQFRHFVEVKSALYNWCWKNTSHYREYFVTKVGMINCSRNNTIGCLIRSYFRDYIADMIYNPTSRLAYHTVIINQ